MSVIRFPSYYDDLPRLAESQNQENLDNQNTTESMQFPSFYDFFDAQQAKWRADLLRLERLESENAELVELLAKAYLERKKLDKLISEMKTIGCSLNPGAR